MNMCGRRSFLLVALVALATNAPALGTSARNLHPELVDIHEVSLNVSLTVLPGLNSEDFERAIRDRLEAAGVRVKQSAKASLFVHAEQQNVPGCDELLVVQAELAVSEDARISRPGRDLAVWVDTYSTDETFVVSKSEAWSTAEGRLLQMLESLLDSRRYTASVKGRRP